MKLIIDDLYKRHSDGLTNENIDKTLINFGRYTPDSMCLSNEIINVIKTSAVCNYTYTQCYDEIRKRIPEKYFPEINTTIAAIVKKAYYSHKVRDIYREAAAHKFQTTEENVDDDMIESVKEMGLGVEEDQGHLSGWDEYYYNICKQVARNSKCLSRKIGAILVKDKLIVATGYNGPPKGISRCDERWNIDKRFTEQYDCLAEKEDKCPRYVLGFKSGQGLDICVAAHAEANTILMCARKGIKVEGSIMYMTCGIPCKDCLIKIIQTGVKELVVTKLTTYDDTSMYLLENSEVKVRLSDFIK